MKGDTNLHGSMMSAADRCLWCEKREEVLDDEGLCDMCSNKERASWAGFEVSLEMSRAWSEYSPHETMGEVLPYQQVSRMVRHAFMSGFLASQPRMDAMAARILDLEDVVRRFRRDALDRLAALSQEVGGYTLAGIETGTADTPKSGSVPKG